MSNTSGKVFLSFRNPYDEITGVIDTKDYRSGSSVKDWQARMIRGLDCSTPFTRSTRTVTPKGFGNWAWQWRDRPNSLSQWTVRTAYATGHIAPLAFAVSPTIPTNMDNDAKSRFIKKLYGVQQSMDGGVALGEIRETLNGIRHPLKSLRDSIGTYMRHAKKRGLKAAHGDRRRRRRGSTPGTRRRAVVDALTGTYLEWKFGIQPLILDIKDAIKALDRMSGRLWTLQRISGHASWTEVIADNSVYENSRWVLAGAGISGPQQMAQVKARRTIVAEGRVTYSGAVALESHETELRKEIGLAPNNWLPTVWNLLPWSWAVDMAFDVGSVLSALCAPYSNVRWCNQAVHLVVTETWSTAGLVTKTFSNTSNREDLGLNHDFPSIVEIRTEEYTRTPIEASLWTFVPKFTLEMPDPVRLLNLTSAIWQSRRVSSSLHNAIRNG